MNGSINTFQSNTNIKYFSLEYVNNIMGNIETCFINKYKLASMGLEYQAYNSNNDTTDPYTRSPNISGNISVFADKYDLQALTLRLYINVNGQVKDLKNLKKIYFFNCYRSWGITGSQSDLWNNGANCSYFNI